MIPMRFSATVVRGDGIGRKLGYPTANLDIACEGAALPDGVYAAHAVLGGVAYAAALVVDRRFDKVEVHLLDFGDRDLYGEILAVDAGERVSDIEEMALEDLPKKIVDDIVKIRRVIVG